MIRHRRSRRGDRQANASLYHIVLVRMANDPTTSEYVAKRTESGLRKKEITRFLKCYGAWKILRVMKIPRPAPLTNALRPLRLATGLTQAVAVPPWEYGTTISRIERGLCRDHEVVERYRTWLEKQVEEIR